MTSHENYCSIDKRKALRENIACVNLNMIKIINTIQKNLLLRVLCNLLFK